MAKHPSDQETTLDDSIDVASLEGRRHLTLLVVSGPAGGQWHLVPAQGGTIGRHPECDVMVGDPAVSRRQARVTLDEDGSHWIEDLGSRNGTFISGKRIDRAPLADGDQIQLSSASVLRVRYLGAQETLLVHQLQEAASTDALTGVANRRYLLLRLSQELSYAKRHRAPVCVLMIDLDDLKRVNDDAGRLVGDGVLQEVAQHLENEARLEDIVARYGGDEFVIVARGLAAAQGVRFAERLREQIETAELETIHGKALTLSVGVAHYDPSDPDVNEDIDIMNLLARADAAVFEAKTRGGISIWRGGSVAPEDELKKTRRNPKVTVEEMPKIEEPKMEE